MIDSKTLLWAEIQSENCQICPRSCGVNRTNGEIGYCGTGEDPEYFLNYVGYGEETILNPSNMLFLTGCNLQCVTCHTAEDQKRRAKHPLDIDAFKKILQQGEKEGAINLNLLGGDPAVNLPGILRLLSEIKVNLPPLIWNSSSYYSRETAEMVAKFADIYALDLKTRSAKCAKTLLDAEDYPRIAEQRLREVFTKSPEKLIVRHLVVPGHFDCCTLPVLEWLAENLPECRFSPGKYYHPCSKVASNLNSHNNSDISLEKVIEIAETLGLKTLERSPGTINPHIQVCQNEIESLEKQDHVEIEFSLGPNGAIGLLHPTKDALHILKTALELGD